MVFNCPLNVVLVADSGRAAHHTDRVAEGHTMLFPLTPLTFVLGWIGHMVYGAVLGFALARKPGHSRLRIHQPSSVELPELSIGR
jgi:hypothetical protein